MCFEYGSTIFMLSKLNELIRALVCAGIYIWELYWFNLFLNKLPQATLDRYEQPTFKV